MLVVEWVAGRFAGDRVPDLQPWCLSWTASRQAPVRSGADRDRLHLELLPGSQGEEAVISADGCHVRAIQGTYACSLCGDTAQCASGFAYIGGIRL